LLNLGSDTPENTSSRFSDNDCNIIIIMMIICSKFECKKALYKIFKIPYPYPNSAYHLLINIMFMDLRKGKGCMHRKEMGTCFKRRGRSRESNVLKLVNQT